MTSANSSAKNKKLVLSLVIVVTMMFGAAYAAVPLYQIFCQVTGYGGTTQIVRDGIYEEGLEQIDRMMTIRFNADTNKDLPWEFTPEQSEIKIHVGKSALASYHAENHSEDSLVGTAVYNVTPAKAGEYFVKQECFCFTRQELGSGESTSFPVSFYIDPSIAEDKNLDDVKTITLSYTFYEAKDEE